MGEGSPRCKQQGHLRQDILPAGTGVAPASEKLQVLGLVHDGLKGFWPIDEEESAALYYIVLQQRNVQVFGLENAGNRSDEPEGIRRRGKDETE